jgi:death-on-curing protein
MSPMPLFLTLDEVLTIHADQIERYGGMSGVRDLGLLQSAIAQPQASFSGQLLYSTLFEMAAAYLFHLVKNHPFVDGNKRVGTAAALVFLEMNDIEVTVAEDHLAAFVFDVAQGLKDKLEITNFLRQNVSQSST